MLGHLVSNRPADPAQGEPVGAWLVRLLQRGLALLMGR